MSAADSLSQPSVERSKPFLAVVPAPEVETRKESQPDPLASIRRTLEDCGGVLALGCGCYLKVNPEALRTLPTQTIVESLCESAGNCCHVPVFH